MLIVAVILLGALLCTSKLVSCLHEEWRVVQLKTSEAFPETSNLVHINVSPNDLCVLDSVNISWTIEESSISELFKVHDASLIVVREHEATALEISLGSITPRQRLETSTLTCLINDLFCTPKTQQINLLTDVNRLVITFDHETNKPPASTREDIEKFLRITPSLQSEVSGIWLEAMKLELQLDPKDVENIIFAHKSGHVTEVSTINPESEPNYVLPVSGSRLFRTSEHGKIKIFAIHSKTHEIISNQKIIEVKLCPEQSSLPSSRVKFPTDHPANSVFHMPGIFPISGTRAITVTNKAVPAIDAGTWSIAVWMKLLQEPIGSFRTIMFKGSAESGFAQRTPSVWLLPDSNHITLRMSTEDHPDTDITSRAEIPVNEWSHLCFVFRNVSAEKKKLEESFHGRKDQTNVSVNSPPFLQFPSLESIAEGTKYVAEFYLNGARDIRASFRSDVKGNNASLLLFKDVTFSGPKAFVEGLQIWDSALSPSEITQLYSEGMRFNQPVDEVIELLEEADSPLLPYYKLHLKRKEEKKLMRKKELRFGEQQEAHITNEGKVTSLNKDIESDSHENIESDTNRSLKEATSQGILELLVKQSKESIEECQSFIQRLDIHSESSEMGSTEGFLYWSKLLYYGFEIPNSKCGFSSASSDIQLQKQHKRNLQSSSKKNSALDSTSSVVSSLLGDKQIYSIEKIDENLRDLSRAVFVFLLTIGEGKSDVILPLSFSLLQGIGLESLIYYDYLLDYDWDIPIPLDEDFFEYQTRSRYRSFRKALGSRLVEAVRNCSSTSSDEWIGFSTLCSPTYGKLSHGGRRVKVDRLNQIALGLIYLAALFDQVDAYVALAYRYEHGLGGVIVDIEMAAQYSLYPADVASNVFHTIGAQPVVETDRIDDNTEADVGKGNLGDDDEMIQYQKIRAAEGDIPSILALGDLYYYGARGLPRDQPMALQYFNQAANLGDPQGMCGAAAMYLKGEGTPTNVTKAVELYEKAAERNASIRAYNGLGYLYFFGSQVPKNETKAFEYFQLAAQYGTDGDSLFNSGYCLENGIGVEKSLNRAIEHYTVAAKRTGHFDSIKTLAIFHMEGKGVARSAQQALVYLNAAKGIGPWMGWIRRGFDLYLAHKATESSSINVLSSVLSSGSVKNLNPVVKSLLCYLYVGELGKSFCSTKFSFDWYHLTGFEVAQSNAAYLIRSKILPSVTPIEKGMVVNDMANERSLEWFRSDELFNRLLFRQYLLSGKLHLNMENIFYLGNCYFFHKCGLLAVTQFNGELEEVNYRKKALYYYQIASYGKNPVASTYLGMIYHFNLHSGTDIEEGSASSRDNFLRANRYYEEVLQYAKDPQSAANQQSMKMYYFVQGLQTLLKWRSYSALYPFHKMIDECMRWFWS